MKHRVLLLEFGYFQLRAILLALVIGGGTAWPAAAADRRWTGDAFSNNWSEDDNWSPSGPPQDGETLIFGNLASHKSNRNDLSNLRVQSILFNGSSGGYTLNGNPILLNSDITAAHTSGNNNVRFGVQFTHGGGAFSVVNGGRMEIAGAVTLANNQSLIVLALGTNLTISGAIVGDGDLTKLGSQALFLTGTGANTYTGLTTIQGGAVYLVKSSGAPAISSRVSIGVNTLLNSSLRDLDGGQYPPAMSVVIGPLAIWALTNGATVNSLTLDNGFIRGEGLLNLQCNVTNYGYSQIDCSLNLGNEIRTFFSDYDDDGGFAAQLEVSGHILQSLGGNPAGITKEGPGLLILKNQNTYSGPTLVNDGDLVAEHPQALGTAAGITTVRGLAGLFLGKSFASDTRVFSEPVVMEGGLLGASSDVILNAPLTLNADSVILGPDEARFDVSAPIGGIAGLNVRGGHVRFSGPAANTFAGAVVVQPGFRFPEAVLELAKPNDMVGVPTTVTLQGFGTNIAVLRQFQQNGVRDIFIDDGGVWHLNGYAAAPNLLAFLGGGLVDTGPGSLNFSGLTVNTQLQVLPKLSAPSNYTARILGRILSFTSTNDLFIPPGVTLDITASIGGTAVQKRGPGKLIVGGDNHILADIFALDGEVVSTGDRALGAHTTVADGATLWLASTFNFGSLTLAGRGFQGQGALATDTLALFSSNILLSASATLSTPTTDSILSIIGSIRGVGSLRKDGVGLLIFGGNTANTFTGDTLVNAGTLELGKNDFLPAVPGDIVIGSGPPQNFPAKVIYSGHDQVWNRITVNRGSLLDLNNRDEYSGDVTLNEGGDIQTGNGTLYLGTGVNVFVNPSASASGSTLTGRISLGSGSHRFQVGRTPGGGGLDLDVSATIAEMLPVAGIVKEGPGAIGLRASNTFTGTLIIEDGNVSVTHPFAFGPAAAGTIVNGNGTLTLSGDQSGSFWVRDEPLILNSTNPLAFLSFGRSNTWSGNITLQRTAGINVASFGVLNLMGFFDCCGGVIRGPGGLTKGGSGTLLITGFFPNEYTGPTVVNDGLLEAWRILSPALPGDVVVTGDRSILRTGHFPASAALASTSAVTVRDGALWELVGDDETIRALLGDGRVGLGVSGSLTVNTTNSCEFAGVLSGVGPLTKTGPATLFLSGNSPSYFGGATVTKGTLRVDGKLPATTVTVKTGAQLRGDGMVGSVNVLEQDSVVQVDASVADHPGRQGGDLEATSITLAPGGVAGFGIFGPSPNGGNDLLIARGPVTLGNARLSTGFSYAPREGDVITLLRKDSAGPINGIFAGWPEGIMRKLGDVTVRASYVGGDGNDFTLTVTNLPVRPLNYRLAEGNGNQTVEPDECNLIFPIVSNPTTNALTITNAQLRSLTPGAVVTLPSAIYPIIPPSAASESTTPFQFRTERSLSCGQPVTFELIVGVKNEGLFALVYEITAGEGNDCNHPTGGCESCHVVSGRFTPNAPTLLRSPNFIGAPSLCFPPKRCPDFNASTNTVALPYLAHSFTNATTNELCLTAQLRFDCSGAPTSALGASAYLGTNDYHGPCVNYLGDTGVDGTQPFSFRVPPLTNFLLLVSARATNVVCPDYTLELFGLPCPPPTLHIVKDTAPGHARLYWSTAYPDYNLQATNVVAVSGATAFGSVNTAPVIVGGQYTVTNSITSPEQFFRLGR